MIESAILVWDEFAAWYATAGVATQMAVTFAVSVVASRIFAPNVPQSQQNNVRQQVPPDPTAGIPLVYGDAYTGGRFCDAVLTSESKNNVLHHGDFQYQPKWSIYLQFAHTRHSIQFLLSRSDYHV